MSDIVKNIIIDPRKLTHYALDYNSPYGKDKAILFEKVLGFTKENHMLLIYQIQDQAMQTEALFHSEDQFGKRYTLDIQVEGIKEKSEAIVRTGWFVPIGVQEAHLVTLYVMRR
ncbi:DUF6883 domain-containing protein [Deltaproteobacteria bacterium TL4]